MEEIVRRLLEDEELNELACSHFSVKKSQRGLRWGIIHESDLPGLKEMKHAQFEAYEKVLQRNELEIKKRIMERLAEVLYARVLDEAEKKWCGI